MDPDQLRGLGPFADLDHDGREELAAQLAVDTVPAGTDLLVEGQPAPGLMVLRRGRASVHRRTGGQDRELAVLGHGAFIGELSLLDRGAPATATVTTLEDVEVVVPVDGTGQPLLDHPVVGPPVRAVAERRRATNRVTQLGPVRVTLDDGSEADLRPLWPDDWRLMEAGQHRTSRQSLHQRFFSVPKLTETLLRRLSTVDYVDDFAWIALGTDLAAGPGDDLLGVGRFAHLPDRPGVAEIALMVADDRQGSGLGTRLLVALAVAARDHGIGEFEAVALGTNRGIQRLLERAGATWRRDPDDAGHVLARWPVTDVLDRLGGVTDVDALAGLVRDAVAPEA